MIWISFSYMSKWLNLVDFLFFKLSTNTPNLLIRFKLVISMSLQLSKTGSWSLISPGSHFASVCIFLDIEDVFREMVFSNRYPWVVVWSGHIFWSRGYTNWLKLYITFCITQYIILYLLRTFFILSNLFPHTFISTWLKAYLLLKEHEQCVLYWGSGCLCCHANWIYHHF